MKRTIQIGFEQYFRKVGGGYHFKCRECGQIWMHQGKAAHEVAFCGSRCLNAHVGRMTVIEYAAKPL